jgi:hypothetical protein
MWYYKYPSTYAYTFVELSRLGHNWRVQGL